MNTVQQILQKHGHSDPETMEIGEEITVENQGYMDLVIEKVGDNQISVAHYKTQLDDLIADPEIVFKIQGQQWIPVRYTQHPFIHQHNENGLQSLQAFIKQWDQNLKKQGFINAAKHT